MRWLLVFLVGCAQAGSPGQGTVDSNTGGGGSDGQQVQLDGSMGMIDAPSGPMEHTLSQTTSPMIKALNTVACPGAATGSTAANNYYRVFDLPAMGITGAFNVTKVSFQIEHCKPTSASATTCANFAVRVGTYTATPGATLATASMNILASNATVTVPKVIEDTAGGTTPGGTVDAPLTATIPAGSKLLVEVDAPYTGAYAFYMGSNDGGETGFGYVMAPSPCNITVPSNISGTLGMTPAAPRHLLLTVTGTY